MKKNEPIAGECNCKLTGICTCEVCKCKTTGVCTCKGCSCTSFDETFISEIDLGEAKGIFVSKKQKNLIILTVLILLVVAFIEGVLYSLEK